MLGCEAVGSAVAWYFRNLYGVCEGPGSLPFYCDPDRVGAFAVVPERLASGTDDAIFRVFVTLSMYQALRDVVIMQQQRSLPHAAMLALADASYMQSSITKHGCPVLRSAESFEEQCNVSKRGGVVDCGRQPGARCHVKDASRAFNRMGDMGKLPTSAWLRFWRAGGMSRVLTDVYRADGSPRRRALLLVDRFTRVYRVGRKLATMFVSALSTPALAPGLTPWFPEIDGHELVVVDTNVARAAEVFLAPGEPKTYDAREQWIREQAAQLDLRKFRPNLRRYSPRLVQQAITAFCSKSNRISRGDACVGRTTTCPDCAPDICPFRPTAPQLGRTRPL
jgi:hypothetical protein